jgi:glucans biosynthesis protein C
MPSVTDVAPTPERLHAVDAVWGFALLLGIILHTTVSFIPAPTRFWIIRDAHPSMLC